jgi:hypothetical protein
MAYLEIVIAGVAAFLLGFGWYTFLFGKAWQAESGITDAEAQSNMARTHGLAFIMMCVIAYGINYVINFHAVEDQTFIHGAFHGILASLLYAVPATVINYVYQRKSLKLFLIDAGYILAFMALEGGVLAALKLG